MTEDGFVVTVQEEFPANLQFLTDGVGPDENPVGKETIRLMWAHIFSEKAAGIVADRVRAWYDNHMPDHEVEVGTRKAEITLKDS